MEAKTRGRRMKAADLGHHISRQFNEDLEKLRNDPELRKEYL